VIAILSSGIARIPHLAALLGDEVCRVRWSLPRRGAHQVAGWGARPSAARAAAFGLRHGLPFLALEDGFVRSLGLGVEGAPALSIVVDDLGIYYDASRPSRLERLIAEAPTDERSRGEARRGLALLRDYRLSKYNHAPPLALPARQGRARLLLIDQTVGDRSVELGGAGQASFDAMLAAALQQSHGEIWVKTHPDVLAGKKRGYLAQLPAGVRLIAEDACPMSLLTQFDQVYCVTSHMGFEALAAGCRVVCFGLPWYAGWGLTDDRHPAIAQLLPRRGGGRTLEQLFHSAYLRYARYIQPETGAPGDFFDLAEWIQLNRQLRSQTSGTLWCLGMSWWKRAVVWPFLKHQHNRLHFVSSARRLPRRLAPDSQLVVWGQGGPWQALAAQRGLPLLRMEDGFLRSVGLGCQLLPPLSLALDRGGMYYDPQSDSDLLQLLNQLQPDAAQCMRAARLRQQLGQLKISKYNVGGAFRLAPAASGKVVILVPGQVEDDASLRCGSPLMRSNLALLQAARARCPQAWIIYKPHPDVASGNRPGALAAELLHWADQVADDANIVDCIAVADEVHTMTSLAGFEALLQGKTVYCYGAPFYAGWGLTHDQIALPQRRRRLSLDQLVYTVLIAYPRYVLPEVQGYARVEAVVARLQQQKAQRAIVLNPGWLARQYRKGLGLLQTLN
jgi:capsular polysaccharide export protein